jgi:hypothetical protein
MPQEELTLTLEMKKKNFGHKTFFVVNYNFSILASSILAGKLVPALIAGAL